MASFSPAWAVEIDAQPSSFYRRLLVIVHLLACLAVWLAGGMPVEWRLILIAGVVMAGVFACRAARQCRIRLRDVGEEWWIDTGHRKAMVRLCRGRCWRWLAVMEFRGEWKGRPWRQHVVVWPDSVDPDAFRRLRVRMRCAKGPSMQS
ncbi:MAG TPA: protein YgfX [Moraxellaceae bacterium]|nr:protein YgfX [Moraxellaceae bacterium]